MTELKEVVDRYCGDFETHPVGTEKTIKGLRKAIWDALTILEREDDFACKAWNAAELLRNGLKEHGWPEEGL